MLFRSREGGPQADGASGAPGGEGDYVRKMDDYGGFRKGVLRSERAEGSFSVEKHIKNAEIYVRRWREGLPRPLRGTGNSRSAGGRRAEIPGIGRKRPIKSENK